MDLLLFMSEYSKLKMALLDLVTSHSMPVFDFKMTLVKDKQTK